MCNHTPNRKPQYDKRPEGIFQLTYTRHLNNIQVCMEPCIGSRMCKRSQRHRVRVWVWADQGFGAAPCMRRR